MPDGTRLVMEKPFGTDPASAQALNALVSELVPEDHVHRVDHFLGMSTVLNILGVRFANRMLEPVLTPSTSRGVEIVFDEDLALEGRAGYYDHAGALMDMLQSHLLQVLALFAMEPTPTLDARELREGKTQVLRSTQSGTRSDRVEPSGPVHGRDAGREAAPSYADEQGVEPDRPTETLSTVELAVDTWRWAGVPFRLRSGKALGTPRQEVVINFRDRPSADRSERISAIGPAAPRPRRPPPGARPQRQRRG